MTGAQPPAAYRGARLGLPADGPGSLTTTGPRLGALVVDVVASGLVAALFVAVFGAGRGLPGAAGALPGNWSLVPLAVDYLLGLGLAGRTVGMRMTGTAVVAVDRARRPGPVRPLQIVVRTALLFLLVPAIVFDRDGRGLHDRLSGTAVVRS